MEILLNDKNEVISYVTLGEIDGAIEVKVPDDFINNFTPGYYRYTDNAVIVNTEYEAPEVDYQVTPSATNMAISKLAYQHMQDQDIISELQTQNAQIAYQLMTVQGGTKQ